MFGARGMCEPRMLFWWGAGAGGSASDADEWADCQWSALLFRWRCDDDLEAGRQHGLHLQSGEVRAMYTYLVLFAHVTLLAGLMHTFEWTSVRK